MHSSAPETDTPTEVSETNSAETNSAETSETNSAETSETNSAETKDTREENPATSIDAAATDVAATDVAATDTVSTETTSTEKDARASESGDDSADSEALAVLDKRAEQPTRIVEQNGVRYTILGTAHVSKASADEVERLLDSGQFDTVALELDPGRYAAIRDPEAWAKLDLFKVIREGRAGMVAASLALGAFQQRLADQFGIEPGAEMRAAIRAADEAGLPIKLIDRDIGTTLKRVYRNIPWWQRLTLFSGLIASVVSREEIAEDDIEKLKEGDVLEATFAEFAEESRGLYDPLIAERDAYMAAKLRTLQEDEEKPSEVLVVIGAGHLKGLVETLEQPTPRPTEDVLADLDTLPPPSRWRRVLPWAITALVLTGFAIGFARSPELGLALLGDWTIINGGLAALGALIALAHPLTIVGVFLAAPLTSLNPTIGAGFVAAGIELWFRRPNVGDFSRLRQDVTELRGWWRNRVAKTLLVFVMATLGSAIGTYLAGFRIIGRLVG